MRSINEIIVHCSATREGQHIPVETIKKWHVEGRGWSDIGYHFYIELDGTIKKGRDIDRSGAHTKGHNKNSIGICYVGGCDSKMNPKDTRTPEQIKSMNQLVSKLKEKYNASVHGHNEFSSKACPAFNVKKEYNENRKVQR